MGQTAVIPAQIVDVAARSLLGNNTGTAAACQTISFAAASTGDVLTVQGDGSVAFAAAAGGGIGGSTGSTDNAVLRADGTGGATLQASAVVIPDNYTSSPNATVNHASIQATGATTNVSVSVVPKGTGSFSLQVPDGTATGGNARGANAVDMQTVRTAATQVAAGTATALLATQSCTVASNATYSAVIASSSIALQSGNYSAVIASQDATLSPSSFGVILGCYGASLGTVNNSVVLASQYATASRSSQITFGSNRWTTTGDRQSFWLSGGIKTTTNAAVEINFGLGVGNAPVYITLAAGRQISGMLIVQGCKSDGTVTARYCRLVTIRRVSNTTTLDDSSTVGTDLANSTSLSVTADSTNHRLNVSPTGILGETWRWQADFHGIEQAYGT